MICQGSSWKDSQKNENTIEDFVQHFLLGRLVREKPCSFSILWDSNNILQNLVALLAGFGVYLTRKQIFFSKLD